MKTLFRLYVFPEIVVTNMQNKTLCDKCQVLEFADSSCGGWKAGSEEGGGFYLGIPERPGQFGRMIQLDYKLRDDMPDLSSLRTSAQQGCGFCHLLRVTIREQYPSLNGPVNIRLCYEWGADNHGLISLMAYIKPDRSRGHLPIDGSIGKELRVGFGIDGLPGM